MKLLTIKNKADVAKIYIEDEIIDDSDGGWLGDWRNGDTTGYGFPAKLRAQLDEVKDKPLEIHINSYGGSVFAGTAMANMIANHKPKTTAIIDGIAASIASQIFFAADECKMPSNTYLMIHRPFSFARGNADDMRKAAEILDTIQNGIEMTYRKKALDGITDEEIHDMVNAETWLTGADAVKYFKVELAETVKALNCAGFTDKLKAIGAKKIPESFFNFSEKKRVSVSSRRKDLEDKLIKALGRI